MLLLLLQRGEGVVAHGGGAYGHCLVCNGTATNRSEVVDDIVANGKTIAELLDNLINTSDEEMRKEVEHD